MRIIHPAPGLQACTGTEWPGVRYFSSWRTGGISQPPWDSLNLGVHVDDDPHVVHANRARLRAALPAEPLWLEQVHGTAVWRAGDAPAAPSGTAPCADAAVTLQRGRPLAILTADCLPVVLADAQGTVLGVAHAGWRGLAAGVLENTLAELRALRPEAAGWRAWLGPAIGPQAFEVGPEVRAAFLQHDAACTACFKPRAGTDRWLADLAGLARMRLQRLAVSPVEDSGECTWSRPDRYYSYRRTPLTGRQATVAWLV